MTLSSAIKGQGLGKALSPVRCVRPGRSLLEVVEIDRLGVADLGWLAAGGWWLASGGWWLATGSSSSSLKHYVYAVFATVESAGRVPAK